MDMLECEDEVRDVEPRHVGRESSGTSQVGEQFSALNVLEQKVEVRFVLKGTETGAPDNSLNQRNTESVEGERLCIQVDDERVLDEGKSVPLGIDVLDLPQAHDGIFLQTLHREVERLALRWPGG